MCTKAMIEKVRRALVEESEAALNMNVKQGRNNKRNLNRQTTLSGGIKSSVPRMFREDLSSVSQCTLRLMIFSNV